jgi:hypothetical protein
MRHLAMDVEERHHVDTNVLFRAPQRGHEGDGAGAEVAVGERDGLWLGGGAGGMQQQRHVLDPRRAHHVATRHATAIAS